MKLTTISAADQIKRFGEVVITPDTEMDVEGFKSGYSTVESHGDYPRPEYKKECFIVGFANKLGYTDVYPFEIIKVNTARKLTVREMDAELDKDFKCETVIGGFAGHTTNNHAQSYAYSSNEKNEVREIRYSVKNKIWTDKYGNRYSLAAAPYKFYDYNF